jgi:RHS repeat-associated protein
VEKKVGSVYTEYVYGAFGELVATHDRTTWTRHYAPPLFGPLAAYEDGLTRFIHKNHLGSSTFLTDNMGAVTQKTLYYPFGRSWAIGGTVKDDRFASLQQRDAETTGWQDPLDPTPNRTYTSGLGRWLSPDPLAGSVLNPQSLNRYSYVLNNPANLIDPMGLDEAGAGEVCVSLNGGTPICASVPGTAPAGAGAADNLRFYLESKFRNIAATISSHISGHPSGGGGGGGSSTSGDTQPDVSKTWQATFPCSEDATKLMSNVQSGFGQFANNPVGPLIAKFPDQPLKKGAYYNIYSGLFMFNDAGPVYLNDLNVTVTEQTPNAWVFTTDPANHFFDGTIAFRASDGGNGTVSFTITASGNFTSIFNKYILGSTIRAGEESTWTNLLNNLRKYCSSGGAQ